MKIANFLSSGPKLLAGSAPTSGKLVAFDVPIQEAANWCWAAVGLGVANFYGSSNWTQCTLAGTILSKQCCGSPTPSVCDVYGSLDASLTTVGHLVRREDNPIAFTAVQTEIGAKRPLGARIEWSGGSGAHFVALGGWKLMSDGTEFVEVYDPLFKFTSLPYNQFVSGYRSNGDAWRNSYFTHPSPPVVAGARAAAAPTNA